MKPYQFTILQYIHDEITGEFANVGALLWFPDDCKLLSDINFRYSRLTSFFDGLEGKSYRAMAEALDRHIRGKTQNLQQVDLLDRPPRELSALLPTLLKRRSGCFAWSPIMAGLAVSTPAEELSLIMEDFVTRYESRSNSETRNESQIWSTVEQGLIKSIAGQKVERAFEITSTDYEYEFHAGWMNSTQQVAEAISFDLKLPNSIREKAVRWSGRIGTLRKATEFQVNPIIARPTSQSLQAAFDSAYKILTGVEGVRNVWMEDETEGLIEQIEADVHAH